MQLFRSQPGPQQIQGTQISTSVNSLPTPICYGTPRWSGNLIWLNGFAASPAPTTSGKGGGKDIASYVYNAWFIMALSEGPICQLNIANNFVNKPGPSTVIYSYTFVNYFTLPIGMIGSVMTAGVAATGSTTFTIKKNGSTVGTAVFATSAAVAAFIFASSVTFAPGDVITVTAPASPDATLANLSWNFLGQTTPFIKYIDGTGYGFDFSYYTKNQTISALEFFDGDYEQVANSAVVDNWPTQALAYRGISYAFADNYRIDASATVPQLQFVASTFLNGTCPLNNSTIALFTQTPPYSNIEVHIGFADADPASCIYDLLTNPIYGAGFPADLIDPGIFSTANAANANVGDTAYQTYCQAVGFGFSVALDSTESASSIIQRWCDLTNTAPVWTGTALKFIPYGDLPYSANPGWASDNPLNIPFKYFVPDVTPLFSLGDNDFEQSHEPTTDPITIDRKDIADIYNTVRLSFKDRTNAWNQNVSEAKDENAVDLYGIRVDNLSEAKEFTLAAYAAISAQLRVQRNVAIDRTFTFKLSWAYCILDPMDVIEITDVSIGLVNQPVRVISIEEDEHGVLEITTEILLVGSATAILYETQSSIPSTISYVGAAPSPVFVPVILEPTALLLAAQAQPAPTIQIGVCGGISDVADVNWGGAVIYISIDNITYSLLGTINGPSRMGLLTGNVASGATSVSVDLGESAASLETVTSTQAGSPNYLTLCCMVKTDYSAIEFFTYTTATLTSAFNYTLTGLSRGLYGTTAQSWSTGDLFLRLDPATFEAALPAQFIGKELYVKFLSFNTVGLITDTLADATAYTYTPTGVGTPASMLTISGSLSGKPTSSQTIFSYVFVGSASVQFPINFAGSQGNAAPLGATATATFNINKNGSNIGTMVFAGGSGGAPETATFTLVTATTFAPGDILTITAPAVPDTTLANLAWSFLGTII